MLNIPGIVTDHYVMKGLIPEAEREIYEYGFDITFYTAWSTTALLLIGAVVRQFIPAAIMIFGFYLFQTTGGGYHADTHLRCFAGMAAGLSAGLSLGCFEDRTIALWVLFLAGFVMLALFPLVLHPNKRHLEGQRGRLTTRSLIVTILVTATLMLLVRLEKIPLFAATAVIFLSGLSRVCGRAKYYVLLKRREDN